MTPKQILFCEEYLKDFNATRAAIRAGYSDSTAKQIGSENLTKLDIAEYIKVRQGKMIEKVQVDNEWVLQRLKNISDDCYKEGGMAMPSSIKATELIAKHIGFFAKDNDQSKPVLNLNLSKEQAKDISNAINGDI